MRGCLGKLACIDAFHHLWSFGGVSWRRVPGREAIDRTPVPLGVRITFTP